MWPASWQSAPKHIAATQSETAHWRFVEPARWVPIGSRDWIDHSNNPGLADTRNESKRAWPAWGSPAEPSGSSRAAS